MLTPPTNPQHRRVFDYACDAIEAARSTRTDRSPSRVLGPLSSGEQVLAVGYLIAMDYRGLAREVAGQLDLDFTRIADLSPAWGAELARAMGWRAQVPA